VTGTFLADMRRTLPLLVVAVLVAACSGSKAPDAVPTSVTTAAPDAPLPQPLADFLSGAAEPGSIAFRATYRVLRKLGGRDTTVDVVAAPPSWSLHIDDLVVVDGPSPATCRVSKQRCVVGVRDQLLAPTGVFSRFFATAPARALATDGRRVTAGAPQLSMQTVAGVALHCAAVPISGSVASTYCLTAEGVFGFVDTPAVHYELTSYAPGPPGETAGVPFPVSADDRFLTAP
jgi:hypothetical protein